MIRLPADDRQYTSRVETLVAALNSQFPDARSLGIYNRRRIAGSRSWSQHAYGNACDIASPYSDRTPSNPAHMAYLDTVAAWLRANKKTYGIRVLLWRRKNHWDHIHVDFAPKQRGVPPIIRATTRATTSRTTSAKEEKEMKEYIIALQESLNQAGFKDSKGRKLKADGDLGPLTKAVMLERDRASRHAQLLQIAITKAANSS